MAWRALTGWLVAASFSAAAQASNIELSIDSSLADYVLAVSCSGEAVDEPRLRASTILQTQIKHHSGMNERYSIDAYIEGLKAASRCETPADDIFRFRYAVEEKEELAKAIAFLNEHEDELLGFVVRKTAPYFPPDRPFSGSIVLSAAGQSCGGFSMDGAFFIDLPCVAGAIEEEFQAIKILAAHETYHALQYAFFAPFDEDMKRVDSPAAAQSYLFMSLLLEGSAEFVADSREVTGEGSLARLFRNFAAKGYRRAGTNLRMIGYAAEVLGQAGDSNRRVRDMYALGFMGDNGQPFYYAGAVMAQTIEAAFGREALVCIMALTPEQFVLAYDAAAQKDEEASPIGRGAVHAALALGAEKRSYSDCVR